jgi:hypothetical protein
MLVVAKVRQGREKPCGKLRILSQPHSLLIESYECFSYEILCVGLVVHVSPGKSEKRLFPPLDKTIECCVLTPLQGDKQGPIV